MKNKALTKEHKPPISSLLKAIEKTLQWGDAEHWSSQDFEKLTALIQERTGVVLSSNTLKRIWGRIKYESNPSTTTLNTLSQFLGLDDFRHFTIRNQVKKEEMEKISKKSIRSNWSSLTSRPSLVFVSGAVLTLLTLLIFSYSTHKKNLNPDDFYFTSKKVTQGLPNSVIFEYRATNAPLDAKIEIQQSWDSNKRQVVSRTDSLATSIYYDPGYFKAKLVVDGQTIKEHGVLIPSLGWKAKVKNKEQTLYFTDSSITGSGKVLIDKKLLAKDEVDQNFTPTTTTFRYVDDFKDLRVNDLVIKTTFRNTTENAFDLCQKTFLTLLVEGEVIRVPNSKLGCISDLELWHFDELISGKNNDLSMFGVDSGEWVTVNLTFRNDLLTIQIDNNDPFELSLKGKINKFHGLIYHFDGTGEIKSVSFKNEKGRHFQWPKNYADQVTLQ